MTGRDARPETGPEPESGEGGESPRRASLRYRPSWRIGLGAAVVLGLAALAVAAVVGSLTGSPRPLAPPVSSAPGAAEIATPDARPGTQAYVHVLGAVADPGIYRVPEGSRVFDALAAAGGATTQADLAAVNLARPIADGEQLYVPAIGEPPPPIAAGSGPAVPASGGAAGPGPVRLNTADAAQLESLPEVGPALAQRIIDWRAAHGGFSSVEELADVAGIGEKTLAALRDLVTL